MTSFTIGSDICSFSQDYQKYSKIRKILAAEANHAETYLRNRYEDWGDVQTVVENYQNCSYELLFKAFNACKELVIENGVYDFNDDLLLKSSKLKEIVMPINKAFGDVDSKLKAINNEQNAEELRREARKDSRTQLVGGGFGLSGALKGMATAGAINMTTGMAHSAFNMVGNMFTAISASSDRSALYDNSLPFLVQGTRQAIFNLLPLISNTIRVNLPLDYRKENGILENIANGSLGNMDLHIPFAQAFQAYPFDEEAYKLYIVKFPEEETKIVDMASFFGIDLSNYTKQLRTVNMYVFTSIQNANIAKSEYIGLAEAIDELTVKGFCNALHKEKSMLSLGDRYLCDYIAEKYSKLKDTEIGNSEMKTYHEVAINYFLGLKDKFKNPVKDYTLTVGFDPIFENLKNRMSLFRAFAKYKGLFLYWNNDIPDWLLDAVNRKYFSNEDNKYNSKDIYFIMSDADDYLVFSAGGIVTKDYRHSAYFNEAKWTKDFFGSTIYIDDTSFSLALGHEAEYLIKIIQGMQVMVSYPAVMQDALNNHDGQASYELAGYFERGEGGFPVSQDLAFKYYYDSALKNNVNGVEKTAQCYESGIGVPKDIPSAKYWYEKAASLGSNSSQEVLNANVAIQNVSAKKDAIIEQKEIQAEQAEAARLTSLFTRSNYITGIIISIFALCLGGWLDGSIWGFLLQWAGIILPIIFTACRFSSLEKSGWYALSMLVPLVNIAVIVYLCIKKGETETKEYEEAIEKINNQ